MTSRIKETVLLQVSGLKCGYGRTPVLNGIDFELKPGEICALIGPNGSGKTTLLRAVAGLLPAEGHIMLRSIGEIGNRRPEERARVMGYLSSTPVIPPDMTACETVEKGFHPELGLLENVSEEQHRKAIGELISFGLPEMADRAVLTLSGGQRQLVLLARAAVRKPPLLLLDEPDSALDFSVAREMMKRLRAQAAETGCGILITSHDVNLMLRYADRLLMLKDGQIIGNEPCSDREPGRLEAGLKELYGPVELIRRENGWLMTEISE